MSHKEKASINMSEAVLMMTKANIMAYVVTSIFILFASILLTYTKIGPKFEGSVVIIGILVSSFLAGFDTAKIDDRNGYKWGAIGGSIYFVVFLILGTVIEKLNHVAPSIIMLWAIVILMTSTIAGIISVNCRGKQARRY